MILEEMSMYHDDPEDSLQDEFDALLFAGHPLGMNILGTDKTVNSFTRRDFRSFVKETSGYPENRILGSGQPYDGAGCSTRGKIFRSRTGTDITKEKAQIFWIYTETDDS